jgi:hypothetical protein
MLAALYHHGQEQSHGVHYIMTLATSDLLTNVVTPGPPLGGLHPSAEGLSTTVYNGSAGSGFPAHGLANLQSVALTACMRPSSKD